MFKKKENNQGFFYHFAKTRPEPSLDRLGSKYYDEMQQLAYNLIRYLKMNDDPHEHSYQGNYNFTYLEENMNEDDFVWLTAMLMRRIPMGRLKGLIHDHFGKESGEYMVDVVSKGCDTNEDKYRKMLINKDKNILKVIVEIDEDEDQCMGVKEIRERLDLIYMIGK